VFIARLMLESTTYPTNPMAKGMTCVCACVCVRARVCVRVCACVPAHMFSAYREAVVASVTVVCGAGEAMKQGALLAEAGAEHLRKPCQQRPVLKLAGTPRQLGCTWAWGILVELSTSRWFSRFCVLCSEGLRGAQRPSALSPPVFCVLCSGGGWGDGCWDGAQGRTEKAHLGCWDAFLCEAPLGCP